MAAILPPPEAALRGWRGLICPFRRPVSAASRGSGSFLEDFRMRGAMPRHLPTDSPKIRVRSSHLGSHYAIYFKGYG